jgi:hypothetical protein
MLELDITDFFNSEYPRDYSASIAELGLSAGQYTWQAANDNAPRYNYVTDENRDEVISHFEAYGAWDREELEAHSNDELCAMLIQDISAAMRESGMQLPWDWALYRQYCEDGVCSGRISQGVDESKVFFYVGE